MIMILVKDKYDIVKCCENGKEAIEYIDYLYLNENQDYSEIYVFFTNTGIHKCFNEFV